MAGRVRPARRGLADRYTDAVQRHRDEYSILTWLVGFVATVMESRAAAAHGAALGVPDLLGWPLAPLAAAAWLLVLAGVGMRVWAAGNLDKNLFSRPAGPYRLVRHPLYLGTLLISLGFFLSLGAPVTGGLLWLVLMCGIFLPVFRKEERELAARFPAYRRYLAQVPALVPSPASAGAAVTSNRFSWVRSRRNFGLRALWFLPMVPALNWALRWCTGWCA